MNILEEIVTRKRGDVAGWEKRLSVEALKDRARSMSAPQFTVAQKLPGDLNEAVPFLIAEVKRRSPSAGIIRGPFNPVEIARAYEEAGARAISVLMDEQYFGGGEEDFKAVREVVTAPLLYKEFVVSEWQVWHARSLGASLVLLIVAALEDAELERLMEIVHDAELEALLEVHDAEEMAVARRLNAPIVGINNRNLRTFETTLETTLALKDFAPAGCTLLSESGIRSAEDVLLLKKAGIDGVLVGECLLRKKYLQQAVQDLMGSAWGG